MDEMEYQTIQSLMCKGEIITVSDIEEISDEVFLERTLLFGYTSSRFTCHVYFKGERIHKLIYSHGGVVSHNTYAEVAPAELIPSKRLYPEACDYAFCSLLITMGIELPFTTFDNTRKKKIFYGKVVER